ncbi:MAG: NADPH-dependent F420 reductase [Acidobacteria bacterium]|nr:NADPH-dependent F420 reductase [Acidobacteriota bacterium]MBI3426257.1 NADPH-dependent F420 reductase [Acidobacteriota bacterium]
MRIAIIGAGNVGAALGAGWARAGHAVTFGVRDTASVKANQFAQGIGARVANVTEAATASEVIVLSTPWEATPAALAACGNVTGKLIVDCTNPLKMGANGLELTIGHDTSGAEKLAALVPGAHLVKAFNQTGFANMAAPVYDGQASVMFVCGEDAASRSTVCDLAKALGFDAIDAGPLRAARLLEPLAMLWIHLAFTTELNRDFAFAVLRR